MNLEKSHKEIAIAVTEAAALCCGKRPRRGWHFPSILEFVNK